MDNLINIAIVDDEVLFRKSLRFVLNEEQNLCVVFDAENGQDFIDYLKNKKNVRPDIVLLDVRMPVLNGIQTSKILSEKYPDIKIIALSAFDSDKFIEFMVQQGAVAYLAKKSEPCKVVETISEVHKNGIYFAPEVLNVVVNMSRSTGHAGTSNLLELSGREIEILQLLSQQLSTKEIADKLNISNRTVDGHRKAMLEKTQSQNVVGLIFWGIKNQVISI